MNTLTPQFTSKKAPNTCKKMIHNALFNIYKNNRLHTPYWLAGGYCAFKCLDFLIAALAAFLKVGYWLIANRPCRPSCVRGLPWTFRWVQRWNQLIDIILTNFNWMVSEIKVRKRRIQSLVNAYWFLWWACAA